MLSHLQPAYVVFMILVFAAAATGFQAFAGLARVASVKRRVNRRLTLAEQSGSLPELVFELRRRRGLNEAGERITRFGWLTDLVVRSGVEVRPTTWILAAVTAGVTTFTSLFLLSHVLFLALPAGLGVGLGGPFIVLKVLAGHRAKALGGNLPNALEIIVRSLEAGHPVPTAVELVGRECPDPIGSEFGMAADEIAFGSTLEQAIGRMAERCRHPDYDLFAATVRLQERTGGNLIGLLKTNASTVRERHRMRMKIQAASSEGRTSAIILTCAPFAVAGILALISPHYYGDVIHEHTVQKWLAGVAVWMFLGNLIMRRMIDMRI